MLDIILIFICSGLLIIGLYFYIKNYQYKNTIHSQKKENEQKVYELSVLKELGERIGYSLNIEKISDIISGSLHQFIDYSAVSYMLLTPKNIKFKIYLESSVSRKFVEDVRNRMLHSLSALLNRKYESNQVDETITGSLVLDDSDDQVNSFFNIPLVINDKVVGVFTVAHTKSGHFQEKEMTILYKITQQASRAVARLQDVVANEQFKLNSMVESMSEGVLMTDNNLHLLVANPAVKRIIGYERNQIVTIFDFFERLKNSLDIKSKLEESIKLKKINYLAEVIINQKYYEVFISPVKSSKETDKILGGVVIFRDISQSKELEKMRNDFTSMLVHELRSPLDGIKKMAKFMQKEGSVKTSEDLHEYLNLIHNSSTNMLQLVNNLLEVAKIESGKFEINATKNDVRKIIQTKIDFYTPAALEKNNTFKFIFDSDISKEIFFDANGINRVLENFISNALKFTREYKDIEIAAFLHKYGQDLIQEGNKLNIHWFLPTAEKQRVIIDDCLVVAVTDYGKGIEPEKIEKLFNKFVQLQANLATPEKIGTGLGLVIAKGIVEAHYGVIGVSSKLEQGTTFYFTIPLIIKK